MRGFRVWSDFWKKYATEAELYMDGSVDAMFEDDDGVTHHENTDLVLEFDTGLKDKNGKEIYGGDIIHTECQGLNANYEVVYHKVSFGIWRRNNSYESLAFHTICEVIGNVHKNPELLEEEE